MAGRRETSLPNLAGHIPGPGRKKMTPEAKIKKKALLDYYRNYLESGEAIQDFRRAKKKQPLASIQQAENRTYGTPTQRVEGDVQISVFVKREVVKSQK